MKFISPKVHAVLDYLVAAFLIIAPQFLPLSATSLVLSVALGIIHFILTILTKFRGGIVKLVPLPMHGMVELVVSLTLGLLSLTYFRHHMADHFYWACLALAIMVVFLCTDYKGEKSN